MPTGGRSSVLPIEVPHDAERTIDKKRSAIVQRFARKVIIRRLPTKEFSSGWDFPAVGKSDCFLCFLFIASLPNHRYATNVFESNAALFTGIYAQHNRKPYRGIRNRVFRAFTRIYIRGQNLHDL